MLNKFNCSRSSPRRQAEVIHGQPECALTHCRLAWQLKPYELLRTTQVWPLVLIYEHKILIILQTARDAYTGSPESVTSLLHEGLALSVERTDLLIPAGILHSLARLLCSLTMS